MPIKMKTPRIGAKPMIYFKGNTEEARKLTPAKIRETLAKSGAEFFDENHILHETQRLTQNLNTLLTHLKEGTSTLTDVRIKQGVIPIRIVKTKSGKIFIHQIPYTHGVTGLAANTTRFKDLISIISRGFAGDTRPNSVLGLKRIRTTGWELMDEGLIITGGDKYSIEFNAPLRKYTKRNLQEDKPLTQYGEKSSQFLQSAYPNQIVSVNIQLDKEFPKMREQKMNFYKTEIQKKFGVPVKFVRGELK